LFHLQDEQYQLTEAVQNFAKMEGHHQRYNSKQYENNFTIYIENKQCSVKIMSVVTTSICVLIQGNISCYVQQII
jgi:archaellum component FlaG (FlaF/FlaG flagellin family)